MSERKIGYVTLALRLRKRSVGDESGASRIASVWSTFELCARSMRWTKIVLSCTEASASFFREKWGGCVGLPGRVAVALDHVWTSYGSAMGV
jgi:hypothetical protein